MLVLLDIVVIVVVIVAIVVAFFVVASRIGPLRASLEAAPTQETLVQSRAWRPTPLSKKHKSNMQAWRPTPLSNNSSKKNVQAYGREDDAGSEHELRASRIC